MRALWASAASHFGDPIMEETLMEGSGREMKGGLTKLVAVYLKMEYKTVAKHGKDCLSLDHHQLVSIHRSLSPFAR